MRKYAYGHCPYAGADHGLVIFGRVVKVMVTPSWWAIPLLVSLDPMKQIGFLCFRLYWWKHDEKRCEELKSGMICT